MAVFSRELSFLSYNCKGFKERNHSYIKYIFEKCDIMLLQETWLYNFESSCIGKVLNKSQSYCISAMNDSDIGRKGRPFGGLSIVWHNKLPITISPVTTTSKRICAINIDVDNFGIILFNIYMPVNDSTAASYEAVGDVLDEISSIIALYQDREVIICGDFNIDFLKTSLNRDILVQFMKSENLTSGWECFTTNNDFTYSSSTGNKSYIDHVLYHSSKSHLFSELKVFVDGENLSDHNPISFLMDANVPMKEFKDIEDEKNVRCSVVDWSKATETHLNHYKYILDLLLARVDVPSFLNKHSCPTAENHNEVFNFLEDISDAMQVASQTTIPRRNFFNQGQIPGWNEFIKPFKHNSIFWCKEWKKYECPTNCALYDNMKLAKRQYHSAIRSVQSNKNTILKNKTAEALANKNFRSFWAIVRKNKCKSHVRSSIIDGATNTPNILKVFHDKYKSLYNSYDDKNAILHSLENVERQIYDKCCKGNCDFDHTITTSNVVNAIKNIKNDKNDLIYGINSNNIIHGTNVLIDCLSYIFNYFIKCGIVDSKFNSSIICPIIKDSKKSASLSSNYRAISLNPIFNKLFEYILLNLIKSKIKSNDFQFGYKAHVSTTICTFSVGQTVEYFNNGGSEVYAAFLDASKAFDKIKQSKLFECLAKRNICPLILRIIILMYIHSNCSIMWDKKTSVKFNIANGVKQGAVLSSHLFSLYLDPLIESIHSSKVGCFMGHLACNIFCYADDIVLLAPTLTSLKILLDKCEKYSKKFYVCFNPDKSKIIHFSKRLKEPSLDVLLNGEKLEIVNSFKHLGHTIVNNRNFINIDEIIHDMKVKCNIILNEFRFADTDTKVKLFNSHCLSLYGSPLWKLDSNKSIEKIEIVWRKCCRCILGLNPRTHNYLLPNLMNTTNIRHIIESRFVNFMKKGLKHNNLNIKKHI